MPEFLTSAFTNGPQLNPLELAIRLLAALAFGFAITAVYRLERRPVSQSFAMTLLLLCVLIAMVTQVIGDSVARAFSLVGALSIVRFRTVVRDTRDTAYVILSVIVGMAVGAKSLWVAGVGLVVVTLAEFIFRGVQSVLVRPAVFVVKLRAGLDADPVALLRSVAGDSIGECELISVATTKQGGGAESELRVSLKKPLPGTELLRLLAGVPGVQSVQVEMQGED